MVEFGMNDLAKKIRYARRHADISQKKLGKKLGVSEMAISAYETGRAIPPWPALRKISENTGFPLEYFTEEKNENVTLNDLKKEIDKIKNNLQKILKLLSKNEK